MQMPEKQQAQQEEQAAPDKPVDPIETCRHFDPDMSSKCRALVEQVCAKKRCSFYQTQAAWEESCARSEERRAKLLRGEIKRYDAE